MKIVVDTNVLISALGWQRSEYFLVRKIFQGAIALYMSPQMLEKFIQVSRREKFGFHPDEIEEFITSLIEVCDMVIPRQRIEVIKEDPSDNMFLECAIEAKADYIVSGDKHLLKSKEFEGIPIINSAETVPMGSHCIPAHQIDTPEPSETMFPTGHDSANIVKLRTSTSCRTSHH